MYKIKVHDLLCNYAIGLTNSITQREWTSVNNIMLSITFILLGLLFTFPSSVRNDHHFTTSLSDSCDSLEAPCMTLSSLAVNTSNYLQVNTELILLPGSHTLHSMLTVKRINQLLLYSDSFSTTIFCTDPTAKFEFTNVSYILISGVKFLGCRSNSVESVTNLTLINTIFDGQQKQVIALKLVNSTVKTEKSFFISNSGGAVIVTQSTATFINCNFNGNHAQCGGAIYGDISSNISIINSTFYCNSA